MVIRVNEISLYTGPNLTVRVPFDASHPVDLPAVIAAINNPAWAAKVAPGVFLLEAALVQGPGTSLRIAAPSVSEVRLADQPNVYLGGSQASVSFDHVTVESWDVTAGGPETQDATGRPFVLYERSSNMDIVASRFSYLGYNDSPLEGVAWRSGTAGRAESSVFDHCEIGAVVSAAGQVTLVGDTFTDNVQDGVRFTGGSVKPVAESDTATGNGGSGFVADHNVIGAVFQQDTSTGNAGAGFAVLSGSNQAVLTEVTASADKDDGFLVQRSTGARLTNISATGSDIGVRLAPGSDQTTVSGVTATGNNRAGISVEQAAGVVIAGATVSGPGRIGVQLSAPDVQLEQSTVTGPTAGIELLASARLDHVSIMQAQRGIVAKNTSALTANALHIRAIRVGLDLASGATARLTSSSVHARVPHRGGHVHVVSSSFSGSPFPWFVLCGVALLVIALLLETIRSTRSRAFRATELPPKVWNTT
jgi:hypothetical protein